MRCLSLPAVARRNVTGDWLQFYQCKRYLFLGGLATSGLVSDLAAPWPEVHWYGGIIGGDGRANGGARDTVSLLMVAASLLRSNPLLA